MTASPNIAALKAHAVVKNQYGKQLQRIVKSGIKTNCIETAVDGVITKIAASPPQALVIYGDPQSGKTEMMICLTAKLLDEGFKVIVHLMNDSVDLLTQNLARFKNAGLAPAPRNATDLANAPLASAHAAVLFCKKNAKDLIKLIDALKGIGKIVVIDDEADYATPNSKVNANQKTPINDLVGQLLGATGQYIGVTATPARLNLNNTYDTKTEAWVNFPPHEAYTGQDTFFPLTVGKEPLPYRLCPIAANGTNPARVAFARFLVTVAYLNLKNIATGKGETNYSFLMHTSGHMAAHKADRDTIEAARSALISAEGDEFETFAQILHDAAGDLYPDTDPNALMKYIMENASCSAVVVLNSKRDRATAGESPTVPTCPFYVIIGGNIVSRGVTFPNLLAMYFTRDVKTKLQQDTYIQRARMFGARGGYLQHFELTIPATLYDDWHRCFVFHRLALKAIAGNELPPVWIGDSRISIAQSSSIDRATVDLSKGEMSFQMFDFPPALRAQLDAAVAAAPTGLATLKTVAQIIGDAYCPQFLIDYLEADMARHPNSLALHTSSSIAGYAASADKAKISRAKGFIGDPQLEKGKFGERRHHIKILYNDDNKARVFYKNTGGVSFVQNTSA